MRRIIFACALTFSFMAAPASALATPAPDAFASAPEPGESPGNTEVEKKAEEPIKDAPAEKAEEPAKAAPDEKKDAPKAVVVDPIPEPKDMGEALKDVGLLIEAARSGNWILFAGILILLLIFVLDKVVNIKQWIPKTAIPWVAATFGIIVSIAMQLTTGIPWGQALLQGLCAGLVATGFWELVFQHVLKKKDAPAE